jgi:hypothetical protein
MQFIDFPDANKKLTTALPVPVFTDGRSCVSCWQMSEEELAQANANGGKVWLGVVSGASQPTVFLTTESPIPTALQAEPLTDSYDDTLRKLAERLPSPKYANGKPLRGQILCMLDDTLRTLGGGFLCRDMLYFVGGPAVAAEHLEKLRAAYAQAGKGAVVAYLLPYVHFLSSDAKPVV